MRDDCGKKEKTYDYGFMIGKGWPYYKNLEYVETSGGKQPSGLLVHDRLPDPLDMDDISVDEDTGDINILYGHINKILKPYVDTVLSSVEGALNLKTGRATLDVIVDQVMEIVRNNHMELDAIKPDQSDEVWDKYGLLRALIEALALKEFAICACRCSPEPYEVEMEYSRYL